MPARDFLAAFKKANAHDPATFNYDEFEAKLLHELDEDDTLTGAKITGLETASTASAALITQLKADKYDLLMKTGTETRPVEPKTTAGSGDQGEEMPSIDSLFKRENTE